MKALILLAMLFAQPMMPTTQKTNETMVYICTGPMSKRYHKTSSCRGLKSCSDEIEKVSVDHAKKMGRTPCKWCYK